MTMILKEIIKLPSLKNINIIAGEEGLDREVQWIYVAECFEDPLESIKWLQGGELIFITGAKMNGNLTYIENFIKGISEVGAAGLLINEGVYIEEVPQEAINIANDLNVPVFTIPWHVRLIDISKEITNAIIACALDETSLTHFLTNILFGDETVSGDAAKKAAYFGYDLEGKCSVCVIDIDKFQSYLERREVFEEVEVTKVKVKFRRIVNEILKAHGFNVPIIDKDAAVILFIKSDEKYMQRINKVFLEIQEVLINRMNGLTVSIGIGKGYDDLRLMRESLKEAEMAVKYSKCCGKDNSIEMYDNIQLYKLLFNLDNKKLESYYLDMLLPIIENDKKDNEITYIEILEMYFKENCNITGTAEKLYLHRNTLKYKLRKIEELLECDLREFNYCTRLKVALDINKILKLSLRTKKL